MVSAVYAVSAVACTAALSRSSGMASDTPPKGNRAAPWDRDRETRTGRNMVERVFNRMNHYRKASTRYDGLNEAFLADPRLILIVIYLKNAAKNSTSVNIGEKPVISHRQFPSFPVVAAAGCAGYGSLLWFWIVRNVCRFLPVCAS